MDGMNCFEGCDELFGSVNSGLTVTSDADFESSEAGNDRRSEGVVTKADHLRVYTLCGQNDRIGFTGAQAPTSFVRIERVRELSPVFVKRRS